MTSQSGKTLAEIYDLIEHDPWQPPVDAAKQAAEKETEVLQKRILDRLTDAGFFDEPKFDPTEDEDPTIAKESSLTMFWRLTVQGKRISEVQVIEPSIEKLSVSLKNTKLGCWIAFTGKRIASRMERSLNDQGMLTQLEVCDINGRLMNE